MREPGLIERAEEKLDRALVDWRHRDGWSDEWIGPAERWSKSVWQRAAQLGPLPIRAPDVVAGKRLAQTPVFICGPARSGTTLVRDLLDGHPSLAVLPSEGRFFEGWRGRDPADGPEAVALHGQRWLRMLANPNHQKPFWLLGRGDCEGGAYVRFARAFLAWDAELGAYDLAFRLQPMAALSAAAAAGRDSAALRLSVDKTPGYEFHLQTIWSRHPDARVIQVVRDPAAIAASYSAGLERTGLHSTPVARMLRNVASSFAAGWRARRFAPANRFLVVRHEDMVANRRKEMERIMSFLELQWDHCLLRQTIMGFPAEPNSSFHGLARQAFRPANAQERAWLAVASCCHAMVRR